MRWLYTGGGGFTRLQTNTYKSLVVWVVVLKYRNLIWCEFHVHCAGLNFWRAPKRKFFAIRKSKPVERGLKRHRDSDVQLSSHECSGECNREWKTKIFKQLESIQMGLENLYEVNKCSPIPVGITKALAEVLKCKICHCIPMKPPLIYAKCCKSIVGCEMCINKWYEGDEALTKPCPLWAQARGYNETQRIRGFDNLSTTVESLF